MKSYIKALVSVSLVLSFLNACKKADIDNDTQSAIDNGICELEFTKVTPNVNGKAINTKGVNSGKKDAGGCPSAYVDPSDSADGFPTTMMLFYDTLGSGCLGSDGKLRQGRVKCVFNAAWSDSVVGTNLVTVTFHDYKVNGVEYTGTVIISKPSRYSFNTQVINGHCTKPGAWDLEWSCDRTLTWTAGYNTPTDDTDDVFELTGSANGKNRNGKTYTTNILSALTKAATCAFIQEGILEITPQGRATRTIDYGDGTCDNDAKVTINGNTYNIKIN